MCCTHALQRPDGDLWMNEEKNKQKNKTEPKFKSRPHCLGNYDARQSKIVTELQRNEFLKPVKSSARNSQRFKGLFWSFQSKMAGWIYAKLRIFIRPVQKEGNLPGFHILTVCKISLSFSKFVRIVWPQMFQRWKHFFFFFFYGPLKPRKFAGWLSGISNFSRFHKNVNSLELLKYISENSFPKRSFWRIKRNFELPTCRRILHIYRQWLLRLFLAAWRAHSHYVELHSPVIKKSIFKS